MSKSTRGIRVAGIASLAVSLSIGVAAPAFAAPGFEFSRIAGDDRYETAVKASEQYGAADDVIIANGQPGEYADALAGNYLAGAEDAPILLTKRSGLPAVTKARLAAIDPTNVWIVGGEAAVPADQEAELEADGYNVERIAGDDRFGTNAAVIAKDGAAKGGLGLIATGLNFPDALAAGPFAYQGHSLGLVRTNSVPDAVGDALEADGVTKVLIFGGTDVVGAGVVSDLAARGITVEQRFAGADRSETSELAAEYAVSKLSFSDEHVGVASGYTEGYGADALAGGPVEGNENSPMLITRNVDNPDDVIDYLENHSDTLADGHIYGGNAAISAAAEAAMEEAAQGDEAPPAGNQDFGVTPTASNTVQLNESNPTAGGLRNYTFSGLEAGEEYDVALFPCATGYSGAFSNDAPYPNEDADSVAGVFQFVDDDTDGIADDTASTLEGNTDISQAGGVGVASTYADDIAADSDGTLMVTIDGNGADCVVPVLWDDDGDNDFELNAAGEPTEPFAVGGATVYYFRNAPDFNSGSGDVISVDKANDTFILDNGYQYTYDSTDDFGYDSYDDDISFSEFETALSVGDYVDIGTDAAAVYRTNPAAESGFVLEDDYPYPPAGVTTQVGDFDDNTADTASNDVRVTVIPRSPLGGLIDYYSVYRVSSDGTQVWVGDTDSDPATGNTETQVIDEDVPLGTYTYRADATSVSGDSSAISFDGATATVTQQASGAPISEQTTSNDVDANGRVSNSDVLSVDFDQPMAALAGDETITLTDADGTVVVIDCAAGATCVLSPSGDAGDGNDTVTITLTAAPNTTSAGTVGGLQYPATVTDSNGIVDADQGLEWNLSTGDVTFE